jgi:hypothetical protein
LERSEREERVESDRELREEPVEDGHSKSESSSSSRVVSEKRLVRSATVAASRTPYSVSRIALVACGEIGFGETIWETERGRPFGMSVEAARASRREEEECLLEDDLLEEDLDDLLEEEDLEDLLEVDGTSRMFKTRPVVGSVVEAWAGSWETWYPSMM